jgi:tRNA(fMet)-specific endonuclease VapC
MAAATGTATAVAPTNNALFLLDTNTASFIIRGSNTALLKRLRSHAVTSVAISSVTEAELLYGLAKKPGASALAAAVTAFLRHVQALPWDSQAATRYGALRAQLEAAGKPLGNMDTLIAAHALAVGATLVTHDKAFAHVPSLAIEDWIEA